MEAYGLEVEEELSTMATQCWAEGFGLEHGGTNKKKLVWTRFERFRCGTQVRGPAGAVMCETRDLGIKCSCWHTLVF